MPDCDPLAPRIIRITKLEAARRQLDTAIGLWFQEGDPVSIHTLAFAAHEILHVICRRKGLRGLMFSNSHIKPEFQKEFDKFIKTDANFLKHARDDVESTKDFNTTMGLSFIIVSLFAGIVQLGESLTEIESDLVFWARIHMPHWFTDDVADYGLPPDLLQNLMAMSRKELHQYLADLRR